MYLYLLFHLIFSRVLLNMNRTHSQMAYFKMGKLKFRLPTRLYSPKRVSALHFLHYKLDTMLYCATKLVFSTMTHRIKLSDQKPGSSNLPMSSATHLLLPKKVCCLIKRKILRTVIKECPHRKQRAISVQDNYNSRRLYLQ